VLVHSKSRDGAEILEFGRRWTRPTPLVAVPTTYSSVSAPRLFEAGYRLVIFANHGLRASVRAAERALAKLRAEQFAAAVEPQIATLEQIYDLVDVSRLRADEGEYLSKGDGAAVILAAGRDSVVRGTPKCMLRVRGRTILQRQIDALREAGIGRVAVVRGYLKDRVHADGAAFYDNDAYARGGEAGSLRAALPELAGRVIVLYGDILFDPILPQRLLASRARFAVLADRAPAPANGRPRDLVASTAPRRLPLDPPAAVARIGAEPADSEFVGMLMLSGAGCETVRERLDARASLPDLIARLVESGETVQVVDAWGGWMDVDTAQDFERACAAPARLRRAAP
jgi:phosphoenolpyruvate phosphomutase